MSDLPLSAYPALEILFQLIREAAHDPAGGMHVYLVGGVIRDLMLDHRTVDYDFAVEGDAIELARRLAARHGGTLTMHPQFRTATWSYQELDIDFTTARTETYPEPAVLPVVQPSTIERDLFRRDFTINAMALRISPPPHELLDLYGGQQDLRAGVIRVLHDHSFIDDPTRLCRAVRFEQRLGFHLDTHTRDLIPDALPYTAKLSGERLRYEFELIFQELAPEKSMYRLEQLGILQAARTGLMFDENLSLAFVAFRTLIEVQQNAQNSWHINANSAINIAWAVLGSRVKNPDRVIHRLVLDRGEATALQGGHHIASLLERLQQLERPSDIDALLAGLPVEVLAAGWALSTGLAQHNIERYATYWRQLKPQLSGKDFTNWGLSPGPLFGTLLRGLRTALLDGLVQSLEDEREFVQRLIAELAEHDAKTDADNGVTGKGENA